MKRLYIWLIRMVSLMTFFRRRTNVIYLMSFDNNLELIRALKRSLGGKHQLIVFYRQENEAAATTLEAHGIQTVLMEDGVKFAFKSVPLLMTARVLFCDNYFAFLAGLWHPQNMRIVQLWHANGAIKRFGWGDPKTQQRSASDQRRFQSVYNHFDEFVVASDAMADVFVSSYRVPATRMQRLGYPRSDRFLSSAWLTHTRQRVYRIAPELRQRRVILYAPTYRDGVTLRPPKGLGAALAADPQAIVVVKWHPLLPVRITDQLRADLGPQARFYDQLSSTDLLSVAETVVTDYSSVAFDYSLLPSAHSLLFFMFDQETYNADPGIQPDLLNWLPSPVLTTTQELAAAIKADTAVDFTTFNQHWNTYNDGQATQRVVDRYLQQLEDRKSD